MNGPIISLIACVQLPDYGVGFENNVLVSLREDMKNFKTLTSGHPVIMGRATWESLPAKWKPLPDRTNIVLTNTQNGKVQSEGGIPVTDIGEAIARAFYSPGGKEEIFILGGANVWEEAAQKADRIYLTEFTGDKPADTFFPSHILQNFAWSQQTIFVDEKTGISFSIRIWVRK